MKNKTFSRLKKVDIFVIHDFIYRPSYRVVRDKISLYTEFNMQLIYLHIWYVHLSKALPSPFLIHDLSPDVSLD